MSDPLHLDTRSGYDRWSEIYDQESNPLVLLEEPVVREWIQAPSGLRVADVGCGTGRHALWLADSGAAVDAFEASAGMMSKASRKLRRHGVQVIEHCLPAPLPVADALYDVVLLALVADHLAELRAAFAELYRVTRPGGQVIFTVLHPAMNLRGLTARFTDPHTGREVRVAAFEHTYGDYVMAPLSVGLVMEEIVERQADAALVAKTPRAEKYLGWPLLLAMRLRRAKMSESA